MAGKNGVAPLPRRERVTLLDRGEDSPLFLAAQANLPGLNRSGLYDKPRSPSGEDLRLRRRIDELLMEHPFYGARRIAAVLNGEGFHFDHKRVGRNMGEMGLHAVYPHRDGSRPHPEHPVYLYLLRDLEIREPDQVWETDITYFRLRRGWMYLVAFMDGHSRYVISWERDQTLELPFVLQALWGAFDKGHRPGILNSEQGSHFTSRAYIALAEERGRGSAWTAGDGAGTTSSRNDSGGATNMRRSTSMSTTLPSSVVGGPIGTSSSTTTDVPTNLWDTELRQKFVFQGAGNNPASWQNGKTRSSRPTGRHQRDA